MKKLYFALALVLLASSTALADVPSVTLEGDAQRLERLHDDTIHTRRLLADTVLIDGIAGLVAGGVMVIPDANDEAWRFAGINTLIFGVVNTIVGAHALIGIRHEESTWETDAAHAARRTPDGLVAARIHAIDDERRESVGHAINLGLDFAYFGIGATAVIASQSGVSHPDRWLASGIAIGAQSLILMAVDAVGLLASGRYHTRFLHTLVPQVSINVGNGLALTMGYAGRF